MGVAVSGNFARFLRSPSFKFVLIGFLVFAISIPLALVWVMLSERQNRAGAVQSEIAKDWGKGQRIIGPFLIVPYIAKSSVIDAGKQIEVERERFAIFLPDTFNASADTKTEIRKRSIYNVTVYRSNVVMEGRFPDVNIGLLDANAVSARWQDAFLALGISDVSGLKNNVELETNGGRVTAFEPSIGLESISYPGIHARVLPANDLPNNSLSILVANELQDQSSSKRFVLLEICPRWPGYFCLGQIRLASSEFRGVSSRFAYNRQQGIYSGMAHSPSGEERSASLV